MKKMVVMFFILSIIVGFFYFCSNIRETETEKLFSDNEMEMMVPSLIRIAPSEVTSFNSCTESNISYDSYYMFDRNSITGWIGDVKKDFGRAAILFYEEKDNDFEFTHLKIKPGIENGKIKQNDYSKPKLIELEFYKFEKEKDEPQKYDEEEKTDLDNTHEENSKSGIDTNHDKMTDDMVSEDYLTNDEPEGPVSVDDYSGMDQDDNSEKDSSESLEIADDNEKETDTKDKVNDKEEKSKHLSKQRKVELRHRITLNIENTSNWQIYNIYKPSLDFDFVNVYVKETYPGEKFPEKVAISELELLITNEDNRVNKKYEDRYRKLKLIHEEKNKIENLKGKATEVFYPEYRFYYQASGLDSFYRNRVKRKEVFRMVIPTFDKLVEVSNLGNVPKSQRDYINSLPLGFDSAKSVALKNVTSRRRSERNKFFIYLENPESSYDGIEDSPIYFPFMEYLGSSFKGLKLDRRLEDSSFVLNKKLRSLFKSNKDLKHFYLVRTHNDKPTGKKKYVFYYYSDRVGFINSSTITGSSNDADPLCMFMYDTKERLVKAIHKEYGKEDHYFIIWDKNNKVKKILIMEIGDFGLRKIQKVVAKNTNLK